MGWLFVAIRPDSKQFGVVTVDAQTLQRVFPSLRLSHRVFERSISVDVVTRFHLQCCKPQASVRIDETFLD